MKCALIACLLLGFLKLTASKQIFINYGQEGDTLQLFKYFHGVDDGFWVQFGGYSPIKGSNTMGLYAQGWTGVTVEANSTRVKSFNYLRPSCLNILSAVGEPDTFVTFYEMGVYSTVIETVKDYDVDVRKKKMDDSIKMPSMSLKQACQRFFEKRPLFFSLDVESLEPVVLKENNWTNPLCRPEIIYSQSVEEKNKYSGLPKVGEVMKGKNYTKLPKDHGFNQIYITDQKYEYYVQKYKEGENILKEKTIEHFFRLIDPFCEKLNFTLIDKDIQDLSKESVFLHFGQNGKSIQLKELHKKDLYYREKIENKRPIVIFHFNPLNSFIIAPHQNYKTQNLVIKRQQTFDLKFTKITVQEKNEKETYEVYVFDHQYTEGEDLPIIVFGAGASEEYKQIDQLLKQINSKLMIRQNTLMVILLILVATCFLLLWKYYQSQSKTKESPRRQIQVSSANEVSSINEEEQNM